MKLLDNERTFKKISINSQVYFLQCEGTCSGIKLKLLNEDHVFEGKIVPNDVVSMAKLLEMETDKFEDVLVKCLTVKMAMNDFEYHLVAKPDGNDVHNNKLIFKQVMKGGIKFQLGSILMTRIENPSAQLISMLDHLVSQLDKFKRDVEELRNSNATLVEDQEIMAKRLTNYTKAKDSLEQELYTKFSMVLNAKKSKIRDMKEKIESEVSTKRSKQHKEIDPSTSKFGEEMDTDEEKSYNKDKNEKTIKSSDEEKVETTTPSLATENIRLDDSFEDDNNDIPRRSRKRLRAIKPKTPVNSVLPRTVSLPRPKSAQPSSAATSRSSRRQTSKEMTADDLLDEL